MADRPSLLRLGVWTTLFAAAATTAQTTNISSDILSFVPFCAQKCFQSFIADDFGICGNSPTQVCLCRQRGSSGYTLGEAAASCVKGEGEYGACKGQININNAIRTALLMCEDVTNAAPRTHTALQATLIQDSTQTGPLVVPTTIQTSTRASASLVLTTSLPTVTLPTEESTLTNLIPSESATSSLPGGATTTRVRRPVATTNPDDAPDPPKLSNAQITGIVVGSVACVILGILLILLARCLRKRRFRDLEESGFFKIKDSGSPGEKKKKKKADGTPDMEISAPIPKLQTSHDPLYPHWQPQIPRGATVGLGLQPTTARGGVMVRPAPPAAPSGSASTPPPRPAAARVREITIPSPAGATAAATAATSSSAAAPQAQTQASRVRDAPKFVIEPPSDAEPVKVNSPPKPTLTLTIPNQSTTPILRPPPAAVRDSVVTEFAEDGEIDPTSATTTVWRPPPSDPQSATAVYFADRGGNWILRNTSSANKAPGASGASAAAVPASKPAVYEVPGSPVEVELPSPHNKTRAERAREAYANFSPEAAPSPLRLPKKPGQQGMLGSPIAFKDQKQQQKEAQYSSPSLASTRPSPSMESLGRNAQPKAKISSADIYVVSPEEREPPRSGPRGRAPRRASTRLSQASVTSIESEGDDNVGQVDLSPVVESPVTPISPGKSPVTYPKIKKRNDDGQTADRYNMWQPPSQSSLRGQTTSPVPRARTVTPQLQQQQTGQRKPWDGASTLRPQQSRNPAQTRTGSPEIRAGSAPPLESQYLQRQRQIGNPASYWNTAQPSSKTRQQPVQTQPPPPPTPPYELPANNNKNPDPSSRRYQTPPQQYQLYPLNPPRPGQTLPTPAATPQSRVKSPPPAAAAWSNNTNNNNPLPPLPQQQQQKQPSSHQPKSSAGGSAGYIPTPTSTTSSQGSQLLAKRRGPDKAAALTLKSEALPGAGKSGNSSSSKKWKKEVVEGGAGQQGQAPGKRGNQDYEARFGPMPITPGWVPELTPTRRGEDLYLDVR
ncbi:hypothetical protein VTJ04DRAFT_10079 [Mycothermus thermophilus]|uniref:uncharacterized protein n=1 Tax=Humicola insolens TaxID=85995 RepID=UPI0037443A5D